MVSMPFIVITSTTKPVPEAAMNLCSTYIGPKVLVMKLEPLPSRVSTSLTWCMERLVDN